MAAGKKTQTYIQRMRAKNAATPEALRDWTEAAPDFWDSLPILRELMFANRVGDDERQTASLTVFVDDGQVKCVLNDRDTDQRAFMTLRQSDWLMEIENLLEGDKVDWKQNTTPKHKKSR